MVGAGMSHSSRHPTIHDRIREAVFANEPLIPCERCEGVGEILVYSYAERGSDPRYGRPVSCPDCDGDGEVENEDFDSGHARETFPPRFPTPAEHAEIAAMQVDYMAMLARCLRPERAA